MEKMTLAKACYTYLRVAGETMTSFMPEYKKLTDKDREDLKVDFAKMGIEITN